MSQYENEREQLLDVFGEFLYVADVHTYELLYMNERGLNLLNLDPKNYKYKKCYEVIQGSDSPCSFCTNKYLSYDHVYMWEYKNPYLGRHFSIHDKLIDWQGRKSRIELSFDITDFKYKVQTLENKIESIVESIPGGICQMADDGHLSILWHNDAFLKIIGYTREQFKAELNGTADYVLPEDMATLAAALEKTKRTRQTQLLEMRIRRRDGESRTLLTSVATAMPPKTRPARSITMSSSTSPNTNACWSGTSGRSKTPCWPRPGRPASPKAASCPACRTNCARR